MVLLSQQNKVKLELDLSQSAFFSLDESDLRREHTLYYM